jgi:hypothetical protein
VDEVVNGGAGVVYGDDLEIGSAKGGAEDVAAWWSGVSITLVYSFLDGNRVDGTYAAEAVDAYLADGRLMRGGGVREVIDGGCHCLL